MDAMLDRDQQQLAPPPSAPAEDDVDVDVDVEATTFRDIHPSPAPPLLRQASWDAASHRSLSSSADEQFMTMSREFTAMVPAGASATHPNPTPGGDTDLQLQLASIGEDVVETNPLAIVPDSGNPLPATPAPAPARRGRGNNEAVVEVRQVKKDEVEAKVTAWQAEEVAKMNNKFKREDVVINGWESQQIHKATAWLNKIERKLEEERAKATEKAQNEMAMARRKAEEKRASAEAKRGTKTAKVLELANFMKAAGRVPTKRSFFSF